MHFKSPKLNYALMSVLVCLWGLEFIIAKRALGYFDPMSLVFLKYGVAFFVLVSVKLIVDRRINIKKRHIIPMFVCSLFGDVIYYACEYRALSYVPVAVLTIILSFVPLLSVLIEWGFFGRRPSLLMVAGIIICVFGIALVIGVDLSRLRGGYPGYILGGIAILSWNMYNFFTESLADDFSVLDLTLYQNICTVIMLLPYIAFHPPALASAPAAAIGGVLYLGTVSGALGFFIYVNAISVLGSTPCALFSTFMPVSAAFFGLILLKERLTPLQLAGGAVVIAAACVVLRQKNLLDARLDADAGVTRK
jgi:drug/metabolite transporter (DMT)-like permease